MTRATHKKEYKILIERDEDGYFVASVPALPGCHTQAKSLPLLMDRVREVIGLCEEVAASDPAYRRRVRHFAYEPTFVGMELVTV